jgi:hypothetical protein
MMAFELAALRLHHPLVPTRIRTVPVTGVVGISSRSIRSDTCASEPYSNEILPRFFIKLEAAGIANTITSRHEAVNTPRVGRIGKIDF